MYCNVIQLYFLERDYNYNLLFTDFKVDEPQYPESELIKKSGSLNGFTVTAWVKFTAKEESIAFSLYSDHERIFSFSNQGIKEADSSSNLLSYALESDKWNHVSTS